jgi:hypothetical protein
MEHFDITNNQQNLFNVINRSYHRDGVEGKPIENGLRLYNYTNLVDFRSEVNYPHQRNNQLDIASYIGCIGKENSQKSKLPEPVIDCVPRKNEEASRFNYAIDGLIDNRMIDISGIDVPNKHLRIIPNRGTQLAYQDVNTPYNPKVEKLANDITNISVKPAESKNTLKYKASRQKLTRQELIGVREVKKPAVPTPVYTVSTPVI